jgi:hypothetical protein
MRLQLHKYVKVRFDKRSQGLNNFFIAGLL